MDDLLSKSAAAARAQRIRENKIGSTAAPGPAGEHTVNVVTIDREGNAASLTATHGDGFGAHVVIDRMGPVLAQAMSRFTLKTRSLNFPAPGKRMQHNMSPMMILRDGRPAYVVGMPGGRLIVTVTAQLMLSAIDFKASADDAVYAPRLHTE